ncbi:sensor histidine kinase [Marinoscillum sp. MHG1-6]|uniref:sensor histidine kinase n=1 Tax=Marinoscillum sp. MHG1-6 TaxID=2959627 RepID=UPI0021576629|nr:ATP-binding protein [Marinoscillum sp. MHG1-6]
MILNRLNITNKLAVIMVAMSLALVAVLLSLFYFQFDQALKERVLLQLSSVKQLKVVKIKAALSNRIEALESIAEHPEQKGYAKDLFIEVEQLSELPGEIGGYPIDINESDWDGALRILDVTTEAKSSVVTLIFLLKSQDFVFVGISELPEIHNILMERTGLGQTGESYLVGEDYKMRTPSRFYSKSPYLIDVKTEGVKRSMRGEPGEDIFLDYRGVEVFSAYEQIEINGLKWVILSEMDHSEGLFPLKELEKDLIYTLLAVLLVIFIVSYVLSRMIVQPIMFMERKLTTMSKGILDGVKTNVDRGDEIGQMFDALNKLVEAMTETIKFAGEIGMGNFDAKYVPLSKEDKLGEALIQMKEKLKEYQLKEAELIKRNQQSILNGEEKERARLSREMHDGLGPLLTTLRLDLQSANLNEKTKSVLLTRTDDTIAEVRRMSNNLMPSVLTDFGAGEAIRNLIKSVQKSSGVEILYKNDMKSEVTLPDEINVGLYRIAQESINNAIKHAGAKQIKVSITEFEDHIGYFISDDGKGFDVAQPWEGNGIRNMQERVKLLNGVIEILSDKSGTTIEVEIPIA